MANGIGRRTGMCDTAGAEAWTYDAMGGPTTDQRNTNGVTKSFTYTYNLDGSVSTLTYPTGRVITYTLASSGANTAARVASAVDSANSINYATNAHYTPAGGLTALTNAVGLSSTIISNSRLQPCWMYTTTGTALPWNVTTTCASTATTGSVLDLKYNFNLGSADNGNVAAITNNRDNTRSQNFTYDSLNRLSTAQTTSTYATSPANCWGEAYFYDNLTTTGGAWGNLTTIQPVSSAYTGCVQESGLSITATTKNQLVGFCYDASGNLSLNTTCPTGSYTPTYNYNAENQMTSTAGVNYTYDGDGKRVQKSSGKLYWYGMSSDPLDETDAQGNTNNSNFFEYIFLNGKRIARRDYQNNVFYYFADHLGTARLVTNSTGSIVDDSDFYPFGGERPITSSSGNRYRFTGKERDSESGLDNFGARYMGSNLGRFMSTDPIAVHPQKMVDPQQFNMYSYVRNNPLKFTDPFGEIIDFSQLTDEEKAKLIAELQKDTGLTLAINSAGDLVVVGDPSKASGGSGTFRKDLIDAINSKDTFSVVDDPNTAVGGYDAKTKTASIDFGFFSKKNDAFTLGLTFYHEVIGHGLYGYGDPEKAPRDDAQATYDLFAGRPRFSAK